MADRAELVPFDKTPFGRQLSRLPDLREQRDPTAATTQLRWTSPDMPMVAEWDADQAVRFGYYANVIGFRCVQIIAHTISGLAFRAGDDPDRPAAFNTNAPLARLLGPTPGGPAPGLAARKLFAWSIAQRMVTGRWAWEIEWSGRPGKSNVVALWPLVSANLKAYPSSSGSNWWRVFTYGRNDAPRPLTPEQVFYVWDPSATDFRQPESALQAARYDLSIAIMGDRYSHSFLKNGAVPAAMVVTGKFANKEDRGRFRRQWNADYRGPDNAGKVAFAEVEPETGSAGSGGVEVGKAIDVKVLGLSQKDAQFMEQHQRSLERVAMALGVPWSRLDASGRTYDNAGAEDQTFWETTILDKVLTYQDEINMGLAPLVGSEVGWFDLSKVRALKPMQLKPADLAALLDRKTIVPNEARDYIGLGPVEGGDEFIERPGPAINVNTAPEAPRALPAPPAPAVDPRRDPVADPDDPRLPSLRPPVRVAPRAQTRMTAAEHDQRRARIWKATDATVTTLESRWQSAFRRLFAKQREATLKRLNGKRGRQLERRDVVDASSVFDAAYWRAQSADVALDLYEAVGSAAAVRLTDKFAVSFTMDTTEMQRFVQARSNQLAGQVTDTTYGAIKDQLAEGAGAGETIQQLAARIEAVFDEADKNRAVTIARTEVISAYNGTTAEFAAMVGTDVVAAQEWIATRDARTRESHAEADGTIAMPGQPFDNGLMYPGDPNGEPGEVINCRCTVALLTPAEVADLNGEETGRTVPAAAARALIAMARHGEFDEQRLRAALREAAA
jgi:HK97 family phage portal protein